MMETLKKIKGYQYQIYVKVKILTVVNIICITINFNNPIAACFSNRKYPAAIQTRTAKILNNKCLIEKVVLFSSLNIIGVLYKINYLSVLVQLKHVTRFQGL